MVLTWQDLVVLRSMFLNLLEVSRLLHQLSSEISRFLDDKWTTIIAASTLGIGIVV